MNEILDDNTEDVLNYPMYVRLNENGDIIDFTRGPKPTDEFIELEIPDDIMNDRPLSYRYINNEFVKNDEYINTQTQIKNNIRIEEQIINIKQQLDELDTKTIRPLRAILAGMGADDDKVYLAELETQAVELRQKLAELEQDANLNTEN